MNISCTPYKFYNLSFKSTSSHSNGIGNDSEGLFVMQTQAHIGDVRKNIGDFVNQLQKRREIYNQNIDTVIGELQKRGEEHDKSKLLSPERELFIQYLSRVPYGTIEYTNRLDNGLKPALEHHYSFNRHHPQNHKNGIQDMNLIDLTDMLSDWDAATKTGEGGNILHSIEVGQERFGYPDNYKKLFINTVEYLGWAKKKDS